MATSNVWHDWAYSTVSSTITSSACNSTTGSVWYSWNTPTTTTSAGTNYTWYRWTTSNADTPTSDTVWVSWDIGVDVVCDADTAFLKEKSPTPLKQDRIADLYRRNKAEIDRIYWEERQKELEEERRIAEETAQTLLKELIGEEEMATYKETGRVLVHGKQNDYIIRKDSTVVILPKGKVEDLVRHKKMIQARSTCIVLSKHTPMTDKVIGLKLALENNEEETLKVGNHFGEQTYPHEILRAACAPR